MVIGTFSENTNRKHVTLRELLLGKSHSKNLPDTILQISNGSLERNISLIKTSINIHGFCLIRSNEAMSLSDYISFGEQLGIPLDEVDPATQKYHISGKVLDLKQEGELPLCSELEPFSSSWLPIHSERSQQPIAAQPRYISLMCHSADDGSGQTLLVNMDSVVSRLDSKSKTILQLTCYQDAKAPPFVRKENGHWIISFLDFQQNCLRWVCEGDFDILEVNSAIENLLVEIYKDIKSCHLISWKPNMLLVIDNNRFLHGRTKGLEGSKRRLFRLRLLQKASSLFVRKIEASKNFNEESFELTPIEENKKSYSFDFIDDAFLDIFNSVSNPTNPFELHDMWFGKIESSLGKNSKRKDLALRFENRTIKRSFSIEEVLSSKSFVRMVKEISNTYFRDDVYGKLYSPSNVLLSTGSTNEIGYGLGPILSRALHYAIERDWYGYSDSLGKESTRNVLAEYETVKMRNSHSYNANNIVLTMGATQAVASLAEFIFSQSTTTNQPAIIAIPNYPPMVEVIARYHSIKLVPTNIVGGSTSLLGLIEEITPNTPIVFFQTVTNPTGTCVNEFELAELIRRVSSSTIIILDETHEWLGPEKKVCLERTRNNVIRVKSISKQWSAPGLKVGWFIASDTITQNYYEYASSSYGCPPSITYTMIEILARFEMWYESGKVSVTSFDLDKFSLEYNLGLKQLEGAYHEYLADRARQKTELLKSRTATTESFKKCNFDFVLPDYSINAIFKTPLDSNSYTCFREILQQRKISFYPTSLNFMMSDSWLRLTYGKPSNEMKRHICSLSNLRDEKL